MIVCDSFSRGQELTPAMRLRHTRPQALAERVLAAQMRLAEGDRDNAQQNFAAWSSTIHPAQPHHRNLRQFALEHGLVLAQG